MPISQKDKDLIIAAIEKTQKTIAEILATNSLPQESKTTLVTHQEKLTAGSASLTKLTNTNNDGENEKILAEITKNLQEAKNSVDAIKIKKATSFKEIAMAATQDTLAWISEQEKNPLNLTEEELSQLNPELAALKTRAEKLQTDINIMTQEELANLSTNMAEIMEKQNSIIAARVAASSLEKIGLLSDFDGTLTRVPGENLVNQPFYRTLLKNPNQQGYRKAGINKHGDDEGLIEPSKLVDALKAEFITNYENKHPGQRDPHRLTEGAIKFLHFALAQQEIGKAEIHIRTKNNVAYVEALLKLEGFTNEQIKLLDIVHESHSARNDKAAEMANLNGITEMRVYDDGHNGEAANDMRNKFIAARKKAGLPEIKVTAQSKDWNWEAQITEIQKHLGIEPKEELGKGPAAGAGGGDEEAAKKKKIRETGEDIKSFISNSKNALTSAPSQRAAFLKQMDIDTNNIKNEVIKPKAEMLALDITNFTKNPPSEVNKDALLETLSEFRKVLESEMNQDAANTIHDNFKKIIDGAYANNTLRAQLESLDDVLKNKEERVVRALANSINLEPAAKESLLSYVETVLNPPKTELSPGITVATARMAFLDALNTHHHKDVIPDSLLIAPPGIPPELGGAGKPANTGLKDYLESLKKAFSVALEAKDKSELQLATDALNTLLTTDLEKQVSGNKIDKDFQTSGVIEQSLTLVEAIEKHKKAPTNTSQDELKAAVTALNSTLTTSAYKDAIPQAFQTSINTAIDEAKPIAKGPALDDGGKKPGNSARKPLSTASQAAVSDMTKLETLIVELQKLRKDIQATLPKSKMPKMPWRDADPSTRLLAVLDTQILLLRSAPQSSQIKDQLGKLKEAFDSESIVLNTYYEDKSSQKDPNLLKEFIEKHSEALHIIERYKSQLAAPKYTSIQIVDHADILAQAKASSGESQDAAFARILAARFGNDSQPELSRIDGGNPPHELIENFTSGQLCVRKIDGPTVEKDGANVADKPFIFAESTTASMVRSTTYQIPDSLNPLKIFEQVCPGQEKLFTQIMQSTSAYASQSDMKNVMQAILDQNGIDGKSKTAEYFQLYNNQMRSEKTKLPKDELLTYAISVVTSLRGKTPINIRGAFSHEQVEAIMLVALDRGYTREQIHVSAPHFRGVTVSKSQLAAFHKYAMLARDSIGYEPLKKAEEEVSKMTIRPS